MTNELREQLEEMGDKDLADLAEANGIEHTSREADIEALMEQARQPLPPRGEVGHAP